MKTLILGTALTLSIAAFSSIASANPARANSTRYDEPIPGLPTSGRMASQRLEFAQKHNVGVLDLAPLSNSNGQPTSQTSNPSSNRSSSVGGTSGGQIRQQLDAAQKAPQTNTASRQ